MEVSDAETASHIIFSICRLYGVWASQVASDIATLFEQTRQNPAQRCKGARFEPASQIVAKNLRKKGGENPI